MTPPPHSADGVSAARTSGSPAAAVPIEDEFFVFPTSFSQQRLWFLNQLIPDKSVYVADVALRLDGEVDIASLRGALGSLIGRHESLRTTFVAVDGEPFQRVTERIVVPLEISDVDSLEQARDVGRQLARRPFDMESGPLWRAALLRVRPGLSILEVCMHHIVTDGWSMGVFSSELSALYNARVNGRDPALPELPIQYGDFAVWQRRQLQGERLAELLGFWRGELDGLSTLALRTDRPHRAIPTFRGGSVPLVLDANTARGLRELSPRARRNDVHGADGGLRGVAGSLLPPERHRRSVLPSPVAHRASSSG